MNIKKTAKPTANKVAAKKSTSTKVAAPKSSPKKSQKTSSGINPDRISSARVTVDKDSSISVREIENGFLVSESGTTGKGKNKNWYSKDYYSATNPVKISTPTFGKKSVK